MIAKKAKTMRTIKHKAYAVVQPDMLKDMPVAMVFNPHLSIFSEAVFSHEYAADKYADIYSALLVKVVPCTVTFELPDRRHKKNRHD